MMMMKPVAVLLSLMSAAVFTIGPVLANDMKPQKEISVTATGQVEVAPDVASIQVAVESMEKTAREALEKNSQRMRKILAGLKTNGIAEKDIRTDRFDIRPLYDRLKKGRQPVLTAYQVTNQIGVVARDIAKLGALIDQLVSLGASNVNSITFEVSDAEKHLDDARRDAIAKAYQRAKLYAAAAGARVGDVLRIREGEGNSGPSPIIQRHRMMAKAATPIAPGRVELQVTVHVSWALIEGP